MLRMSLLPGWTSRCWYVVEPSTRGKVCIWRMISTLPVAICRSCRNVPWANHFSEEKHPLGLPSPGNGPGSYTLVKGGEVFCFGCEKCFFFWRYPKDQNLSRHLEDIGWLSWNYMVKTKHIPATVLPQLTYLPRKSCTLFRLRTKTSGTNIGQKSAPPRLGRSRCLSCWMLRKIQHLNGATCAKSVCHFIVKRYNKSKLDLCFFLVNYVVFIN